MKSALPLIALLGVLLALPAAPLAHAEDDDRGKIMSLSFEDAPITDVISAIARYSGKNIIVGPNVKGSITIDLTMVDAMTALKAIAKSHGLTVTKEAAGILRVEKQRRVRAVAGSAKPHTGPEGVRFREWRALEAERVAKERAAAEKAGAERSRRHVDLVNQLAESKARIAALEREIARAEAEKRSADVRKYKESLDEVTARLDEVESARAASYLLQVYDVRDLDQRNVDFTGLLAALEKQGARIQDKQGQLVVKATQTQHAKLRKALNDARDLTKRIAASKRAKGAIVAKGGEVVRRQPSAIQARAYDVSDIPAKDKRLAKLLKKIESGDARVLRSGTNLIVYGRPKLQVLMAQGLKDLRAKRAKDTILVVGEEEIVEEVELPAGKTDYQPAIIEKKKTDVVRVRGRVLDANGRVLRGFTSKGGKGGEASAEAKALFDLKRLHDRMADGENKIKFTKTRIENLERALAHLKAAEAKTEAERVAKQLAEAKDQYAQAKAWFSRAQTEAAEARKRMSILRKRKAERDAKRTGRVHVELAPPATRGTNLQSLHADVRALRGEVRALTDLVKQLIEMQAGPPRRRGR